MFVKRLVIPSAIVFILGCGSSTLKVSGGDSDQSAGAAIIASADKDGGATELDVDITLPEPPPVTPGIETVDLRYVFEISNRGASPATVKRINIAGAAGAYKLESWSRTYKKTIAPGAKEKLSFLARAVDINPNIGTRAPMTVRAQIEFENADGLKRATFVRNVGGTASFGVTRDQ